MRVRRLWKIKFILLLLFAAGTLFVNILPVFSADVEEDYSYSLERLYDEMDEQFEELDNMLSDETFSSMTKELIRGDMKGSFSSIIKIFFNGLRIQFENERDNLWKLFLLGILSAFLVDFSAPALKNYVGDTGYFGIYTVMMMILLVSFYQVYQTALDGVKLMFETVGVIIPVYVGALFMAGDVKTGIGVHALVLGSIAGTQWLVEHILLPMIFYYFVVQMMNFSMKEDRFSRFSAFLKQIVTWSLRLLFGIITGMQVVQCLLLPVTDQAKQSNFSKSLSAIPGIGASARALTGTILNSATVVKNAVGIAGMLVLVMVALLPAARILLFILAYQLLAALLQPIAHKRVAGVLGAAAGSGKLLLSSMVTSTALYLVCIAMVTSATGILQ